MALGNNRAARARVTRIKNGDSVEIAGGKIFDDVMRSEKRGTMMTGINRETGQKETFATYWIARKLSKGAKQ